MKQDPEVRAIGEAAWARLRDASPPSDITTTIISRTKEMQEVFAGKGHVLESTQLRSDWITLYCRTCDVQWSAFVHSMDVGFFRGLDERCKGAP